MLINGHDYVLAVALVTLTLVGFYLMLSGSRGKTRHVLWSEFRVHLGTALLISVVTITLIDIQIQREIENKVNKIPDSFLSFISRDDHELERAINFQITDNPIRYSNLVISANLDAHLKMGMKPDFCESDSQYAIYNWTTEFDVTNASDSPVKWTFHPSVTSDLESHPCVDMQYPSVREAGQGRNLIDEKEFKTQVHPKPNDDKAEYTSKEIDLKPKIPYHVVVTRFIHDRLKGGFIYWGRNITSGITFSLSARSDDFEITFTGNYPRGKVENMTSEAKSPGPVPYPRIEIKETLLPYQGFKVEWKYKKL